MKIVKRVEVIKAMETLARCINDEDVFEPWLLCGVADGDGDDVEALEYYADDETFSELMALFLRLMRRAEKSGGLYCDGIVSKD